MHGNNVRAIKSIQKYQYCEFICKGKHKIAKWGISSSEEANFYTSQRNKNKS